jgi:hypothetical protein
MFHEDCKPSIVGLCTLSTRNLPCQTKVHSALCFAIVVSVTAPSPYAPTSTASPPCCTTVPALHAFTIAKTAGQAQAGADRKRPSAAKDAPSSFPLLFWGHHMGDVLLPFWQG